MTSVNREFAQRVARIRHHGLGLSVDVYQPDLFELVSALAQRGLAYGYLEVFKAAPAALLSVRRHLPSALLEYHAEGLWMTQPNWTKAYPFEQELEAAAAHLQMLGSDWLNHECAAKQMAGHSFGTYLPPLFTRVSAEVTAEHLSLAQRLLDRRRRADDGPGPLFLLEVPPLTYFGFGDLDVASFFRCVTDLTPCGMVLDIGHLWTIYRYTGEWRRRSVAEFLTEFLDAFPLDRVVQIHLAGLAPYGDATMARPLAQPGSAPPLWIDAHGAPIPDVLQDMLAQVLDHKALCNLKGVALEVDTKPIPQVVEEFVQAYARFRDRIARHEARDSREMREKRDSISASRARPARRACGDPAAGRLAEQYDRYVQIVTGRSEIGLPVLDRETATLSLYRERYLPQEILEWGGVVRDMFPETCRRLEHAGISLEAFVRYWFREPRAVDGPYDFFLLKLDRFMEFVREALPAAGATAQREADGLRSGYHAANETVGHIG